MVKRFTVSSPSVDKMHPGPSYGVKAFFRFFYFFFGPCGFGAARGSAPAEKGDRSYEALGYF
jgi:hypothetical protein